MLPHLLRFPHRRGGRRADDPRGTGSALRRDGGDRACFHGVFGDSRRADCPDRYTQAGYRRVGANAGENAGRWVLSPDGYEMLVIKPPVEERDDFDGDGIDLPEDSFRRLAARARA